MKYKQEGRSRRVKAEETCKYLNARDRIGYDKGYEEENWIQRSK